jgi:hypothetical protein
MIRRTLTLVLIAIYRSLCALTLHRWYLHPNSHGGKPMLRSCIHCGKRQTWHYSLARERGRIKWIDCGDQ